MRAYLTGGAKALQTELEQLIPDSQEKEAEKAAPRRSNP
jgi:hypothetical protein